MTALTVAIRVLGLAGILTLAYLIIRGLRYSAAGSDQSFHKGLAAFCLTVGWAMVADTLALPLILAWGPGVVIIWWLVWILRPRR